MSPAGRPPLTVQANLHSFYVTAEQAAYAKRLGDGNMSAGIRSIIDDHGKGMAALRNLVKRRIVFIEQRLDDSESHEQVMQDQAAVRALESVYEDIDGILGRYTQREADK